MHTPPGAPPPQGPPQGFPPPGPPPQGFAPPGPPPQGVAPQGPPPGGAPVAPADPAKSAAIMLAVAAVLMVIGMFSKSWVAASDDGNGIHFGPMGAEVCRMGMCVDVPGNTMKLPGDVEAIRILALIGGFAATAMAGWFGAAVLLRKRDKLPAVKLANMAFGVGAFGMTFFIVRFMIEGKGVSPSWAGFVAIGGVILASVGLKKLAPHLPAQPAAASAAAPAPQPYGQQVSQPMAPQPYGQQASQPMAPQPYGQQASQPMAPQPYVQPQPQPMAPPMMAPQPMAPPGMAPSSQPQAPAQQFCPRCGTPAQYVAQHQRWFCPREQQYL